MGDIPAGGSRVGAIEAGVDRRGGYNAASLGQGHGGAETAAADGGDLEVSRGGNGDIVRQVTAGDGVALFGGRRARFAVEGAQGGAGNGDGGRGRARRQDSRGERVASYIAAVGYAVRAGPNTGWVAIPECVLIGIVADHIITSIQISLPIHGLTVPRYNWRNPGCCGSPLRVARKRHRRADLQAGCREAGRCHRRVRKQHNPYELN